MTIRHIIQRSAELRIYMLTHLRNMMMNYLKKLVFIVKPINLRRNMLCYYLYLRKSTIKPGYIYY